MVLLALKMMDNPSTGKGVDAGQFVGERRSLETLKGKVQTAAKMGDCEYTIVLLCA